MIVDQTGHVYISGLVVDDIVKNDGSGLPSPRAERAKGDVKEEALVVLQAIEHLLSAVDVPMENITTSVCHLRDVEADFNGLNDAFAKYFRPGHGPCRTTVQAGGRIVLGCLVEITVSAFRNGDVSTLPTNEIIAADILQE